MKRFLWILSILFSVQLTAFAQTPVQTLQILPDKDTLYICPDSSLVLRARGGTNYRWSSPNLLFSNPNADTVRVKAPQPSAKVYLEGVVNGVKQIDSIFLTTASPQLQVVALDATTVCRGTKVRLFAQTNTSGQGITWRPVDGLDDPTSPLVVATPKQTTTYTAILNITGCEARANITVTIRPPQVDILQQDTLLLCKGSSTSLVATTNTGSAQGLKWTSSDGSLQDTLKLAVSVKPVASTTYYTTFINNGCTILDSVFVKVDSIPDSKIEADPKKDPYCQGDIVTLKSKTYETSAYPNIKHRWFPEKGFETPDTLWNLVFNAQDSTIYFRETRNGGCIDTAAIFIPVIKPKIITIVPAEPKICLGDNVKLTASFEGEGEIEWKPEQNISCTKCKDPVVNPFQTTAFTITVKEKGCPTSKSVTVEVLQPPVLQLNTNTTICRGSSITLNLATDPGVVYTWTSPQLPNFTSTEPQLRVTPTTTTTYRVKAQRGNCPAVERDITVTVVQPADVTVPGDQRICPGAPLTLTATGNAPAGVNQTYIWTWNNGQNSSTGAAVTVNNLRQSTTFNLTYVYGPNCGTITKSVRVIVEDVPAINGFTYNPADAPTNGIPAGNTLSLAVNTTPPNPTGITYTWTANGQAITGTGPSIQHKPGDDPTTYSVKLRTAAGCEVSATTPPIAVKQPEFDIPNAFTPNGDESNDYFRVVFTGNLEIREFRVWNRWGQTVYNNLNAQGWDGNINGKPAPSDVYVYKIVVRFPDGREFTRQGDVTLIR